MDVTRLEGEVVARRLVEDAPRRAKAVGSLRELSGHLPLLYKFDGHSVGSLAAYVKPADTFSLI
jgi:hypothetical protein